jgi:Tfp pilus assembly protein PilN
MRPLSLTLDFRAAPESSWRPVTLVLFIAALVIAGTAAFFKARQDTELKLLTARQTSQISTSASTRTRPLTSPDTERQLKRANAVLDALLLPWDDVFLMVEGAGSKGLGLLAITPDPQTHTLRIAGVATSVQDVLDFTKRLAAQPLFSEVHLTSYETVSRDGRSLIEFTIGAQWQRS